MAYLTPNLSREVPAGRNAGLLSLNKKWKEGKRSKNMLRYGFILSLCLFVTLMTGCAKKTVTEAETTPPPTTVEPVAKQPVQEAPVVDVADKPAPAEPQPMIRDDLQTVFFEYDSYALSESARQALKGNAAWLLVNPQTHVTIAGHCDERGSDEYNLALGERRAMTVRDFLTGLGVPMDGNTIISFGEEQPSVNGHDETAWAKNRRVEFKVN